MTTTLNSAIKVQTDVISDAERLTYAIEEGSIVQTETGYWVVRNGAWINLNTSDALGLGWARYDDGEYTSENKLTISDGATVTVPNNMSEVVWSINDPFLFYQPMTKRVYGIKENDMYIATIVFKASAANANSTYGELKLEGGNGTPYERLAATINFPKGNDVEHPFHFMFQYYVDEDFVTNGNFWTITATGGAIQTWDHIMFIQRTQSR
jgi:hypothetical protein